MDHEPLSQQELADVRKLLKSNNAENAVVEFAEKLPGAGKFIGKVGRYLLFLGRVGGLIVALLLLPKQIEEAYRWWEPKTQWAATEASKLVASIDLGKIDPASFPPTDDYVLIRHVALKPQEQDHEPDYGFPTIIASTGVPPGIMQQSNELGTEWWG